ncbi:MAG: acyl carrier protein [Candidatus Sulfotelmatobacter sp.]
MSNADQVLPKVREAFKAVFDVEPQSLTLETSAGDIPGWNSLGHLSLTSHLEQTFGITFDVDELMEMENVREIVRIVSAKLPEKA